MEYEPVASKQKCWTMPGAWRVTQRSTCVGPVSVLGNCLAEVCPVDRSRQASSVALLTSSPIQTRGCAMVSSGSVFMRCTLIHPKSQLPTRQHWLHETVRDAEHQRSHARSFTRSCQRRVSGAASRSAWTADAESTVTYEALHPTAVPAAANVGVFHACCVVRCALFSVGGA